MSVSTINNNGFIPKSCQRLRLPSLSAAIRSPSHKPDFGQQHKEEHRIVVMGSAKVGKSSIISQFLYDKFLSRYRETVEELHRGEYELPDGASLTLDILDTSGAHQFPAMRALSISTGGAFILVYAVDNEETWDEVVRLREQVTIKLFCTDLYASIYVALCAWAINKLGIFDLFFRLNFLSFSILFWNRSRQIYINLKLFLPP